MPEMPTLEQACTPRPSVVDTSARDTVYNIDDLNQIDAGQFFAENWVTEGMHILLDEAFKRLDVNEGLLMIAGPPQELERYFRGEEERWRKVIQDAGTKIE